MSALEHLLRRDRLIAAAGLALVSVLAWLYILAGAGMKPAAMAPMRGAWTAADAALMLAMWWVMMIAMMTPSAAPTILLYARVHRHALACGRDDGGPASIGAFVAGYLAAWLGFSIAATALHWLLEREGVLSAAAMAARSSRVTGALLIAVGLYQFSAIKQGCLSHCRAPAAFLSRHWRPGWRGAHRVGVLHGVYCVGCCWMLMALLFVGGVMNPAWIAALGALVLAEKLLPGGAWAARAVGAMLIAWGAVMLLG